MRLEAKVEKMNVDKEKFQGTVLSVIAVLKAEVSSPACW